jgi:hypothetical protein
MHQTLCAHNYRLASDFGILESEPAGTSIGPTASTTGTIQLRRIVRRRLPVPTRTQWLVRQSGGLSIAQGPWGMLMVSYCGSVAWLPTADSSPGGIGELFVARGPSISNARFNHTLLHSFIPQVLSLQGDLMLHATCVVIDGRAFLFAGDSTLGKSTLAAGFALQGLDVFSDDIVRIEIAPDGTPLAHRGYPGVRLRGNSFLLPAGATVAARGALRLAQAPHLPAGADLAGEPGAGRGGVLPGAWAHRGAGRGAPVAHAVDAAVPARELSAGLAQSHPQPGGVWPRGVAGGGDSGAPTELPAFGPAL